MGRFIVTLLTMAVAVLAIVSGLAMAAPAERQKTHTPAAPPAAMAGTVTAVDNAAGAPRVLGLSQLIQMALERSPELKQADQDIAAAAGPFSFPMQSQ
jgi:hypothetical protein